MTTPRYLLDTNIVSAMMRRPQGAVVRRMAAVGPAQVATSIVVASELRFGIAKNGSKRLAERLRLVLQYLPVLSLDAPADRHYADIRTHLACGGTPIGPNDLLIAAHARALGWVLVTDNTGEFERVPALDVENWL